MRDPGWWTKAEAAAYLEVDARTIERKARAGRIQARARPGFPTLYRQADLEIVKQASRGEVQTGILEPIAGSNGNGNSRHALQEQKMFPGDDPIRQLAAFVVQALTHAPIGPTGPTHAPTGPTPAYVDQATALAIAGVSVQALRQAVQAGEVKQRGRRYRVQDLEQL